MPWRALSLAVALWALQGSAQAICGARPSVRAEARASDAIVLAKVKTERLVVAPDDPEGFEATVYTLDVLRRYKDGTRGRTPRRIEIDSPNTSSRFPMDAGKTYLLFLTRYPSGYAVDACGNSARPSRRLQVQVTSALSRDRRRHAGS
jgi:hypothetical protein